MINFFLFPCGAFFFPPCAAGALLSLIAGKVTKGASSLYVSLYSLDCYFWTYPARTIYKEPKVLTAFLSDSFLIFFRRTAVWR